MRRKTASLRRAAAALLAFSLAAARADAAHAGGSVRVEIEGCSLQTAEVTRLVQLELGSVLAAGADASDYRVTIRCSGADLSISLFDPLTQKSLSRTTVAPPPSQPEPERLVALTVAQLYRAAWLELAATDPPPLSPTDPRQRPPEEVALARRAAAQTLGDRRPDDGSAAPSTGVGPNGSSAPSTGVGAKQGVSKAPHPGGLAAPQAAPSPVQPRDRPWSIGVSPGMRARHLESAVLFPSLEATAAWAPGGRPFWVFAGGGFEWADVPRATGTLETLLVRGSAGVGMEPLVAGPWSAFAEASAGLTYLTISGHASRAPYAGRQIGGAGFDGSVGLGVAARLDAVRVELIGRFGLLAGTPTGIVAGDDDLSLDGPWTGLDLRLKWMW